MVDLKAVIEQTEQIKKKLSYRTSKPEQVEELVRLHHQKAEIQKKADDLRHQKKNISKEIGIRKSKNEDASDIFKEVEEIGKNLKELESEEHQTEQQLKEIRLQIPNIPQDDVPEGADESSNQEIRKWGKDLKGQTPHHYEIAEQLGILDFEKAAQIAGSGFSLYMNEGAQLERALISFMLDTHIANGYEERWVPFLVSDESLTGTGQLPKFEEDLYRIEGERLYLNPTAEVPLTNIYAGQVLEGEKLPLSMTAYAPSFRKEAGSYGKDTRGLIRQHQFNKVELVKITSPEQSAEEHEKMTAEAELILQKLGLPYRVVILSSGDMGFSASKCYDIEVWLPSIQDYKEISSVSNCLDFQARRANIRYKKDAKSKPGFVHTLNGSGLAVGRTFVALIENYYEEDGSVNIPEPLQKYMNGKQILKR